MSTIHTVTLPDGTIAKRTSASRRYPFAIAVSPMTRHELTERIAGNRLSIRRYRAESATVVDYLENGGQVELTEGTCPTLYAVNLKPGNSRSFNETSRGQRSLFFPDRTVKIEGARSDALAYAQKLVAHHDVTIAQLDAQLEAAKAGPELTGPWHVETWTSRLDLAQKALGSIRGHYPDREVRIVETSMRETKPSFATLASALFVDETDECPDCRMKPFTPAGHGVFSYAKNAYTPDVDEPVDPREEYDSIDSFESLDNR